MVGRGSAAPNSPTLADGDPVSRRNRCLERPSSTAAHPASLEVHAVSTSREFLRSGMIVSGATLLPNWARADGGSGGGDLPSSPRLRPFVQELPVPPIVGPVAPFPTSRDVPPGTVFHELRAREGLHRFHPDL